MAAELILHHYDFSSYSEKVRLVLGLKGLSWRSVDIPPVLPKPDYVPLTGGYRRAPALQHVHERTGRSPFTFRVLAIRCGWCRRNASCRRLSRGVSYQICR